MFDDCLFYSPIVEEEISMRVLLLSFVLLLISVAAFAQGASKVDAKAQGVLKQAREAMGGDKKIAALQNISVTGTTRQVINQNTRESELQLDVVLPDKVYRAQVSPFGEQIQVMNAGKVWNDFVPGVGMGSGPAGGFMRMMGGGPGGGNSWMVQMMEKNNRDDFNRLFLALFLTTASPAEYEFVYAGEAKAPDGTADVIDVKGPNGFNARLFFSQDSHQLLMLSYKGKDTRQAFRRPGGGPGGPGGQGAGQGQGGGQGAGQGGQRRNIQEELAKLPPEERAKREAELKAEAEKRQAEMKAAYEAAPEIEYQWSFADYKSVNGVNIPHRITKATGGDPTEEWEFSKVKGNATIKPDKFEKKEKQAS
jgi:hypothetical protein